MDSVALQDRPSEPEFGPLMGMYHFDPEAHAAEELEVEIEIVREAPAVEYAIEFAILNPVERRRAAAVVALDDAALADAWFVAPDDATDVSGDELPAPPRPLPVAALIAFGLAAALLAVPMLGL